MKIIPVEAVLERDIDLLLLEELNSNSIFLNWIIDLLKLPHLERSEGCWKSISAFELGETDLLISYSSYTKRIYILIENKIDAEFQDKQSLRYQQRGKEYISRNNCDDYYCLLVAPESYINTQHGFELTISYEQIRDWFHSRKESRFNFKASLLQIAIEKQRRGYRAVNNIVVQKFRNLYWDYKNQYLPELEMKKPEIVPKGNDWIRLSNKSIKSLNIIIWHKLRRGDIDAQLNGYAEEKINKLKAILPNNLDLERTGKSFSIRFKTVPLSTTKDFMEQFMNIQKAFGDIRILNKWIEKNKHQWL